MPKYKLERKLPSYSVDLMMIKIIEDSILDAAADALQAEKEDLRSDLRVSIEDAVGTATLKSITEYDLPLLADYTKEISLSFHHWGDPSLTISVSLESGILLARFVFEFDGVMARDKGVGFYASLTQRLSSYRTFHFIFQRWPWYSFVLVAVMPTLVAGSLTAFYEDNFRVGMSLAAPALTAVLWLIFATTSPYTAFSTRKRTQISRIRNWVVGGYLGTLAFGIPGAFLFKALSS